MMRATCMNFSAPTFSTSASNSFDEESAKYMMMSVSARP